MLYNLYNTAKPCRQSRNRRQPAEKQKEKREEKKEAVGGRDWEVGEGDKFNTCYLYGHTANAADRKAGRRAVIT